MPPRVDGVFMITRESTRLAREPWQSRDGIRATQELLNSMPAQFRTVCRARGLSPGDFPDLQKFVAVAKEVDFAQFPRC